MCWCNPSVRTPHCGGINCYPKTDTQVAHELSERIELIADVLASITERLDWLEDRLDRVHEI